MKRYACSRSLRSQPSVTVLLVAMLRRPLRRLIGAEAAYWLWLLVPASQIAAVVPGPVVYVDYVEIVAPSVSSLAVDNVANSVLEARLNMHTDLELATVAMTVWLVGALVTAALLVRRHRRWIRSLGIAAPAAGTHRAVGSHRSTKLQGPSVIGVWRPAIILPHDFEARYEAEERALMIAHERAHIERRDLLVSTVSAAWLTLSWFNPLAHWAIALVRFDQDLACDAAVMRSTEGQRRRYAAALVATQVAVEGRPPSFGVCHWQSMHPLTERIAALKRPAPSLRRRTVGAFVTSAACLLGGGFFWISTPQSVAQPAPAAADDAEADPERDSSAQTFSSAEIRNAILSAPVDSGAMAQMGRVQVQEGGLLRAFDVVISFPAPEDCASSGRDASLCIRRCVIASDIKVSRRDDDTMVVELGPLSQLYFDGGRLELEEGAVGTLTQRNDVHTFESQGPIRWTFAGHVDEHEPLGFQGTRRGCGAVPRA